MDPAAAISPAGKITRGVLAAYTIATAFVVITAAWRAASAPNPLPGSSFGRAGWVLTVLHLALLGCLILAAAGGPRRRVVADWLPLLALPLLYAELPVVIATLGGQYHDAMVQGWEFALFNSQPARTLAAALPITPLSELLHASYLSYYLIVYVPPLILYLSGKRAHFDEAVLAVTIAYVMCFTTFAFFPVEGPRYEWLPSSAMPHGMFRSLAVRLLQAGSSRGAAFPSSHVALTVAQSLAFIRWRRDVGAGLLVLSALVALGAVYGGFHYAVDVIAGAGVGIVSWAVLVGVANVPHRTS
ncbi:MAG TPA: phosphatase PAP2 family protein [Gemmatimonadaceae bacterium]|nr:phosphatase PAP2 family protein [Gemmatimonadaceae bacterium]